MNTALDAATPHTPLPDQRTSFVRIERIDDPILLARHEHVAAVGQRDEHGPGAKIDVRAVFDGTIRVVLDHAADVPRVTFQHLIRPGERSVGESQSQHRVATIVRWG